MTTPEPDRADVEANVDDASVAAEDDGTTTSTDATAAAAAAATAPTKKKRDTDAKTAPAAEMSAEHKRALVEQLEFYFSDANIVTDAWLRPRVERSEDGYVLLGEICAFPRMKQKLKKRAWVDVVPAAVREIGSEIIEVSEDGTRVRRLEPIPDVDIEEIKARTVVVENAREFTVAALRQLFEPHGEVLNVRIKQMSRDATDVGGKKKLRGCDFIVADSTKTHALVEFADVPSATEAAKALDNSSDWRNGMRVRFLPKAKKKKKTKTVKQKMTEEGEEGQGEKDGEDGAEANVDVPKKSKRKQKPDYSKWASVAAFKDNGTTITSTEGGDDKSGEDANPNALRDTVTKKLVVTPRSPTMPDGSPGFTRARTCVAPFAFAKVSESSCADGED